MSAELKATYGTCDMYQPVWIMDTDNRYGFGQDEDGTSTPSLINTFQRGPEESVWDTVPAARLGRAEVRRPERLP